MKKQFSIYQWLLAYKVQGKKVEWKEKSTDKISLSAVKDKQQNLTGIY